MTMRINLHEKKVKEAKDLFLPATLNDELGDFLPSLYSADATRSVTSNWKKPSSSTWTGHR